MALPNSKDWGLVRLRLRKAERSLLRPRRPTAEQRRKLGGYWSMPDPEKVQHRASYGLGFSPIGPKFAQEAFWGTGVRWKARNDSQPRSAHEIEGDLRVRESFGSGRTAAAVPFPAAGAPTSIWLRCCRRRQAVTDTASWPDIQGCRHGPRRPDEGKALCRRFIYRCAWWAPFPAVDQVKAPASGM